MDNERQTELLAWLGGEQEKIKELSHEDVLLLLDGLGIRGEPAELAASSTMTTLKQVEDEFEEPPFRKALLHGISKIVGRVPIFAQQAAEGRGAARNPEELPEVPVEGQGTVHRGHTTTGVGGTRPHIYLWFDRSQTSPCSEYFWYQFAQPTLLVDGEEETDEVSRFAYETSGGATMKMGQWRSDFIQEGVDRMNSARTANGQPELPEFQPPGLRRSSRSTQRPKGKPYIGPGIPGHGREGVTDAPNLCFRGANPTARTASNLARVANEFVKDGTASSPTQPTGGSHTISIVLHFRSYLVCIDPPVTCVGFVSWTYTTTATVDYEWRATSSSHAGLGNRRWRRTVTHRGDCTYTLEIGDFLPC